MKIYGFKNSATGKKEYIRLTKKDGYFNFELVKITHDLTDHDFNQETRIPFETMRKLIEDVVLVLDSVCCVCGERIGEDEPKWRCNRDNSVRCCACMEKK